MGSIDKRILSNFRPIYTSAGSPVLGLPGPEDPQARHNFECHCSYKYPFLPSFMSNPGISRVFPVTIFIFFATFDLRIHLMHASDTLGVTWARQADWSQALRPLQASFVCFALRTTLLSRSTDLRQAIVIGTKKKLRIGLVTFELGCRNSS